MNKKLFNKGEDHQHFGLRKLTVGVASVLLGTTFMIYGGRTVQADVAAPSSQQQVAEVAKSNNQDSADQQVVDSNKDNNPNIVSQNKSVEVETKGNESNTQKVKTDNKDASFEKADSQAKNQLVSTDKKAQNVSQKVEKPVSNEPSGIAESKVATKDTITDKNSVLSKEEIEKVFKLDKPDLTADQLKALGLKSNEYLKDGIIYHAEGSAELSDRTGNKYTIDDLTVLHDANGSAHNADTDIDYIRAMVIDKLNKAHFIIKYIPAIDGGAVYINQGTELTSTDAKRGIVDSSSADLKNAENYGWDTTNKDYAVDVNKAGTYDGMVDVSYKIGKNSTSLTKVSVGTHVVVVDLKGKTIYGSASDDGESIDTDPGALITGQPEGSTNIHWITPPTDIDKVGVHPGEIQVTYPDGNTGTATVTYITSNPKWITPTPTTPEGKLPAPKDVITINPGDPTVIPDTKVTWTNGEPDVSNPGTIDTSVTVTYPDGHKTVVPGQIIVVGNKAIIETKEVTRVIIDNVPNQDPIKENQTVTFTREVTKDDKGNVIKATDWKVDGPAAWDAYQAHGAAGYTANPASIPAMAVNPDTKSTRVEINYTKNTSSTPDQPTNPSTPQPTDPSQPTSPSAPQPSAPVDNNDNEPAPAPHASAKPSNPVKKNAHKKDNHKKTVTTPLNGGEKGNGSHSSGDVRPLATKANGYASKDNKRALTAANKITGRKSALPQTGEKQNGFVVAVGAAIATVGSLFGLASRKKRY